MEIEQDKWTNGKMLSHIEYLSEIQKMRSDHESYEIKIKNRRSNLISSILLSSFGLIWSLCLGPGFMIETFFFNDDAGLIIKIISTFLGLFISFSWFIFYKMSDAWLRDKVLPMYWVNMGTFTGYVCLILFNIFTVFIIPLITLAIHMRNFQILKNFEQCASNVSYDK